MSVGTGERTGLGRKRSRSTPHGITVMSATRAGSNCGSRPSPSSARCVNTTIAPAPASRIRPARQQAPLHAPQEPIAEIAGGPVARLDILLAEEAAHVEPERPTEESTD